MWAKDVKAHAASPVKGGTFVPEAGKGCKPWNRTSSGFEDDTSHCHGCNSLYIKLEWIQTISQLSPQFHPPTAPGIIDLIFVPHDRHLEGKSSPASPLDSLSPCSFPEGIVPVLPPSHADSRIPFYICPFLSPCVGLRKGCRTSGGFRKANGKWSLNRLKTIAQSINKMLWNYHLTEMEKCKTESNKTTEVYLQPWLGRGYQERESRRSFHPLDWVMVTDTNATGTEHFAKWVLWSSSEFKHYNFWGKGRRGQNKQVKSYLELLYIKGTPVYMQNFMYEILNK